MEARGCNKTLARGVRHASLSTRASAGARRGRSRCGRGKPTGAGGCPPQPAPRRKVSVRAGSPRGRTKSPRGGKRKGGGGHHHHHQNTPQVDELLGLVRKNRLEDCVRVLSNYPEDVRKETFGSKYLRKTFLDYAKKVGASREAFSFLIEADKVDANCHTSSSLAGSKAESASNLIYYDTRMAGRVIGVCARNGDSRLARKTMDYLSQDKGLQLDIFMYTSAINACARRGEVQKACRLFRQSEIEDGLTPDVFMYCALLKVFRQAISQCSEDGAGEDEEELASARAGAERRSNALAGVSAAAGAEEAEDAEDADGLGPSSSDLPSTKRGLLDRALEYMDYMKGQGIVGDVVLYNCLISTCGRALDFERAESFFWEMQSLGVQPNSKTYSILIHSCLTCGEGDKALEYFRDARGQAGVINAHLCAQAMQAHACLRTSGTDPEGTLGEALRLFKELDIEGVQIDGVASASLVSLAIDLGLHDRALEILGEVCERPTGGERLPPEPFAVAADACAKRGDMEGAKAILERIRESEDFLPNNELGSSLINAFSKAGDLVTSFEVLELLLDRGVVPNSYSFSGLLYACACHGLPVLALKLYSLAKNTGAVTNDPALAGVWCSAVLHAFLKTRREKFLASRETETDHDTGEILGRISTLVDEKLAPFKGRNQIVQGGDLSKEEIVGGIKMVYRDAVTKGYKPSVKVLDMMLECMCTNFYLERIQKVPEYSFQDNPPIIDVSDGAGLFSTTAFALFEEASDLGVLPPCVSQSDLEIKIDFRQLTPVVSEVCLLVLLRSLKRRWDSSQGNHDFKSLLLLLPRPTPTEAAEVTEGSVPLVDRKVKSLLRYIGMDYVNVERDDSEGGDPGMLCIVRPKTIKKCLSNDASRFESSFSLGYDTTSYDTTQEIRMADYNL